MRSLKRCDNDIDILQSFLKICKIDHCTSEESANVLRPLPCSVCKVEFSNFLADQMLCGELTRIAGSHKEGFFIRQVIENFAGKFNCSITHRHRTFTYFCFRSDTFTRMKRGMEEF